MVVTVTDIAVACMVLPWLVLVPLLVRTRQRDVRDALEDGRQQGVPWKMTGKTRKVSA